LDRNALVAALATAVPEKLAAEFADDFLEIRRDIATNTLGRGGPGRFVESLVQVLQHLERGTYDSPPNVEQYLKGLESRQSGLGDGLRICASRIGRAMYSLRSKRSIAHKGTVDPNQYDLRFMFAGAQWVMAELIATVTGVTMHEAGRLVEQIQVPASGLVEVLHGKRVVHGVLTMREEILALLLSYYPDPVQAREVVEALERRSAGSVRNTLGQMWKEKALHRIEGSGYVLTASGLREAEEIASIYAA
jgi:hypothetical protein